MSDLPANWTTALIGDVIDFSPKNNVPDNTEVGFVPLHLMGKRYLDKHGFEKKRWSEIKKGYTHFADGDVLLARITPSFENGKGGIVQGLPNGIGAGSTEYFVCRPKKDLLHPKYLLALFKTNKFLKDGAQVMQGAVGQQRVPKQYVLEHEITLPPLNEQKRIAEKLDSLLARVDSCQSHLERVPKILKRFRQSVLAAATSGRLTEDWRIEKGIEEVWKPSQVSDVCDVVRGASPRPAGDPKYFGGKGNIPWITVGEITKDNKKFLTSVSSYVTEEGKNKSRYIEPENLLLTNSGATLGVPKIIKIGGCINDGSVALLGLSEPLKSYLYYVLLSKTESLRNINQGAAQPNLNTSIVKAIEFDLPSEMEQAEIVRRIEKLFAYAEHLEARYMSASERVERLTPSLLAKAFRGELVSQEQG